MVSTVLTNVHNAFPVPYISSPSDVLAYVCRPASRRARARCRGFKQGVYPQLCTDQLLGMHMRLRSLCSKVVSVIETRHPERCRSVPAKRFSVVSEIYKYLPVNVSFQRQKHLFAGNPIDPLQVSWLFGGLQNQVLITPLSSLFARVDTVFYRGEKVRFTAD